LATIPRGLSKPFIATTPGLAINSKNYINDCINKRLVKFIKKHHSDENHIFWPDLSSAHYATDTRATFDA
jgi:hypothetical protein